MVLLVATEEGYGNLVRLVSRLYLGNPPGEAIHLPVAALDGASGGLICLTGSERGPIGAALAGDHPAVAEARLSRLSALFGDRLYVELSAAARL